MMGRVRGVDPAASISPLRLYFFVDPSVKGFLLLLLSEVSDLSSRVPRVATPATRRGKTTRHNLNSGVVA